MASGGRVAPWHLFLLPRTGSGAPRGNGLQQGWNALEFHMARKKEIDGGSSARGAGHSLYFTAETAHKNKSTDDRASATG